MFGDGEVGKRDTDDKGDGFRDIDDIEGDSECSAGRQNSDAAGPIATGPKELADDSDSDSDLEILGDKTGHGLSDGLMDPDFESQAWTSGAKKPFRPPPPSQSKSQSKSQFFEVDEVPDPTPLTSLSQVRSTGVDFPRSTRTSRGVARTKTPAQREADREKKERQRRREVDKRAQLRRSEKRAKKLLEPRKEDVSQIEAGMQELMSSP
ncbi:MAG: hypothetical protein OHK93_003014 [Ramalina farinacea]|uniref:Uncharacterized protein n=1 Tax=Ramalina farinacea TaxID=258253 RepID=A0AA43QSH2_9LECA|nr:hypothetical protein [Ramalina farinacea]